MIKTNKYFDRHPGCCAVLKNNNMKKLLCIFQCLHYSSPGRTTRMNVFERCAEWVSGYKV